MPAVEANGDPLVGVGVGVGALVGICGGAVVARWLMVGPIVSVGSCGCCGCCG